MINEVQSGKAARKIENAINKIEKETPSLKSVLDAFREIFISRAILKTRLSDLPDIHLPQPDPVRFSQGVPLLTEGIISSLIDPWGESVKETIPPLEKGFPKIKPELMRLKAALEGGEDDLKHCTGSLMRGQEEEFNEIASHLEIQPLILRFILGQMLKPFIERRVERFQPLIENLPWHKGYCPLCGSFPELSFIRGEEGKRWLRCSLCGHEWRFKRAACPFCENEDHEKMELKFIEGREHEWVELCYKCRKYNVNIDTRKCAEEVTIEVVALGMLLLDIVAQEKGFSPLAYCAWNVSIQSSSSNVKKIP